MLLELGDFTALLLVLAVLLKVLLEDNGFQMFQLVERLVHPLPLLVLARGVTDSVLALGDTDSVLQLETEVLLKVHLVDSGSPTLTK